MDVFVLFFHTIYGVVEEDENEFTNLDKAKEHAIDVLTNIDIEKVVIQKISKEIVFTLDDN